MVIHIKWIGLIDAFKYGSNFLESLTEMTTNLSWRDSVLSLQH